MIEGRAIWLANDDASAMRTWQNQQRPIIAVVRIEVQPHRQHSLKD